MRESRTPPGSRFRGNDRKPCRCRGEFACAVLAPLLTLSTPAWAHVHSINFDFVCTTDNSIPGLTLLPLLLLAGIGIARAVARHRKDR